MRYARPLIALTLLGGTWILGPVTPAAGTDDDVQVVTQIDSTPDNGCPAWARDTMVRTTNLHPGEDGVEVSFHDDGTFETSDGREGTFGGDATYQKLDGAVTALEGAQDSLDNSGFPCKTDVPADRTVGNWPLRYVDTQDTPELKTWEWTYTLCGVSFTENADSGEVGLDRFPPKDAAECQPDVPASTTVPEPDLPANCREAAQLPAQYWPHLDGDHDGVSCEDDVPPTLPPAQPVPAQPTFTG